MSWRRAAPDASYASYASYASCCLVKVLHVHAGNMYGGGETILTSLVRYQKLAPGLEQRFALCFEGRLSKELAELGAPVSLLGAVRARRPLSVWRARQKLAPLLARPHADAVVF